MFRAYNINNNTLSIRNMILLFLTIVMGFGAVITLGQISIPSSISNARQTIAQVTITETGINTAPLIDMSGGGIFIDDSVLDEETNFSGKVLGIDDAGNVIYVLSESLVVSGVSAGGGGSGYWTGNGSHIYNINTGNVGIGINTGMSGKLHIKSTNQTELYLQENNPSNAANINLQNPTRTRAIGAFGRPDIFYIGEAGGTIDFVILPSGEIGIGTQTPKANLQILGTFIAGHSSNTITGTHSSIAGGAINTLSGNHSFIGGGDLHTLIGTRSVIAGGNGNNVLSDGGFIGGGSSNTINGGIHSTIGGGILNTITGTINTIVGGNGNTITGENNFIGGGYLNAIDTSNRSVIAGGQSNTIKGGELSTIAGGTINTIYTSEKTFIGGGSSNILSGMSDYSNIVGGGSNIINGSRYSSIIGGRGNDILNGSDYSSIIGGYQNTIQKSLYSVAGGYKAIINGYDHTFIRNSSTTGFYADKAGSFLINVPNGGVGINTNNPTEALSISGAISIGNTTTTTTGAIKFSGSNFFGYNGTNRVQLDN